jgi:hypothetical protein
MVLLAETYMQQKEREKARVVLERVLSDYPASPFVEAAKRFLAVLGPEKPVRAPAKSSRLD